MDTSKLNKNAQGTAAEYLPIVYVETSFGAKRDASMASYRVVAVSPLPNDGRDRVVLMWLRDAGSGRVIAVRGFDGGTQYNPVGQKVVNWPPTLAASLKEPYVGVRRGESVVPLVYYENAGLWEGEPFTLCGPESSVCDGPGLFSGQRIVTGNKYGAARMGANLLNAYRP